MNKSNSRPPISGLYFDVTVDRSAIVSVTCFTDTIADAIADTVAYTINGTSPRYTTRDILFILLLLHLVLCHVVRTAIQAPVIDTVICTDTHPCCRCVQRWVTAFDDDCNVKWYYHYDTLYGYSRLCVLQIRTGILIISIYVFFQN